MDNNIVVKIKIESEEERDVLELMDKLIKLKRTLRWSRGNTVAAILFDS